MDAAKLKPLRDRQNLLTFVTALCGQNQVGAIQDLNPGQLFDAGLVRLWYAAIASCKLSKIRFGPMSSVMWWRSKSGLRSDCTWANTSSTPRLGQVLLKFADHARGGVVHVRNRAGIHHEPAYRRRRGSHRAFGSRPKTGRHWRRTAPPQNGRSLTPARYTAPGTTGVNCHIPLRLEPGPRCEDDSCAAQCGAATAPWRVRCPVQRRPAPQRRR